MKLHGNILIIGDLGEVKAYRVGTAIRAAGYESSQVDHNQSKETQTLELITDLSYIEAHKKAEELVSDENGRFDDSTGEAHNAHSERDKRALKAISEQIRLIIEKESPTAWSLSFPKELHNKLNDMLNANIKKTLTKVVPLNLTKIGKDKLLSHFE